MFVAFIALFQVSFVVCLGYLIRRQMKLQESFWNDLSKLTYYVFTPALLISSLANKPLQGVPWVSIAVTLMIVLLVSSLLLVIWQLFIRPIDLPSFTSVFQGGVRFNSFVALAIVINLFGDLGIVAAALSVSVIIITVNILCLLVFSLIDKELRSWRKLLSNLMLNPLILGCVIGLAINFNSVALPIVIDSTLSMLGQCALPLALLAIGAALNFQESRHSKEIVVIASIIQLLVKPVLTIVLARFMGLEGTTLAVVVIMMAVPTAPSAYILSRQLGGNSQAMASIITSQTVLAFITLPLILHYLMVLS
ncbi:AEC family transporter [Vibrio sp. DW001]|uniref:AEC family transporter n=1 Tax=Vibrio sp. DW001 TaxID=2912315 RepID=UPI0023AF5D11|nr:AEC family transporter [Vibrio sp. DW001]WED29515.1 AEC family transporter [Vibrio sp. DW001]